MYDDISRVRKEKDRAKRRAYVRMVTNMGGSLNLELFCEKVCSYHVSSISLWALH
jgi:peptidyl-prolyl cis-trans isomerase-like 2